MTARKKTGNAPEIKQGQRDILLNGIGEISRPLVHNEIDCAVTKHRHPHEREAGGNKQHAGDKLANGSTARDSCDEHPHKRRP